MSEKQDLCKKFVTEPGDDLLYLVETLVDLRDDECLCVYPSKNGRQCPHPAACPFGFCALHVKTRKGVELATLWNNTLEELEISESSDVEEISSEEEDDVEIEEEEEPVVVTTRKAPAKPVVQEPVVVTTRKSVTEKTPVKKEQVPNVQPTTVTTKKEPAKKTAPVVEVKLAEKSVVEKPKRQPRKAREPTPPPAADESSVAEGSAKTEYVPPPDSEEEEEQKFTFERSAFGNLVNKEHGFVIRPADQVVLGTENAKGGIKKLTAQQKQFCRDHNLNFLE